MRDIDLPAEIVELKQEHKQPKVPAELCLSLLDWLARDIPAPDFLLGEVVSTTSRVQITGPTGLGKSGLSTAMGFSIAAGIDFLHWKVSRAAKVLLIDGEMSRRLVKTRLADATRRFGRAPEHLSIIARDDVAEMPPLNTSQGQAFIDAIIERIGGADLVIFDNVMSLIVGDMKEEEPWQQTLPWIKSLTQRSIGQIWIHHTGINESRGYGTSTREWQLDTVALLERVENAISDIAFSLKFTKCRERTPQNRADFEPVTITLGQDRWMCDAVAKKTNPKKASPTAEAFRKALIDALAVAGTPRPEANGKPCVTFDQWRSECQRMGLIDPDDKPDAARSLFSKYRRELVTAERAFCNGNYAWA